jgi:DNA repair exonuclease SbcCD nuclease subunit
MREREETAVALKLLHTADWHLGRRFGRYGPEEERRLTRARLEVVGRILDMAESRDVDGVVCAGDLFDTPSPEEEWWSGLRKELDRRTWSRPLVLLPGNHDPLTPRSAWDCEHPFRRGLPEYVKVVDRNDFTLEFDDKAILYAVPCRSHAGQGDPTEEIPARAADDERIRIGLVHGQTFDVEGHETNFPIATDAAAKRGLDYLALGDTHGFREIKNSANIPTVYPGAPEATSFGESDAGHVAVVFFPLDRSRRARVEQQRVASWTWREHTCESVEELRRLTSDTSLRKSVLRLRLDMNVSLQEYDAVETLLEELHGSLAAHPRVGVMDLDRDRLRLDEADRADFPSGLSPVLEATIERLRETMASDPETSTRALHHLYRLLQEAG